MIGAPEINEYLCFLASEKNVSASTQSQALSALLFLYRQVLRTAFRITGRDDPDSNVRKRQDRDMTEERRKALNRKKMATCPAFQEPLGYPIGQSAETKVRCSV